MSTLCVNCAAQVQGGNPLDEYVLERIDFRVGRLVSGFHLGEHDAEDLRQDMVVGVLTALPRFDPSRCSRKTFISNVLNDCFKKMAHKMKVRMRNKCMSPTLVADLELTCNDPHQGELSDEDRAGLAMDTADILASMPERLRRVARALMEHGNPTAAAAAIGVHRSSMLRLMQELRPYFEAAGYGDKEIFISSATKTAQPEK